MRVKERSDVVMSECLAMDALFSLQNRKLLRNSAPPSSGYKQSTIQNFRHGPDPFAMDDVGNSP
jgi:hypothetical protein